MQYPFPEEYGHILQDARRIELPVDVDEKKRDELRTEFKDIRDNKPYVFSNMIYILSLTFLCKSYLVNSILHDDIKYNNTVIQIFNKQHMDTTEAKIEAKIEADRTDPIISINKDFMDLLDSSQNYYRVYSTSNFLKDFYFAIESEEISVFYISIKYESYGHSNAVVVHPRHSNIYYIEPHGYRYVDTHIMVKLKGIADQHTGRVWDLKYNMQIQGDDPLCASWVRICVAMIIVNPGLDGIALITSLMSSKTYSLRYTILILWLYHLIKKLTQGPRTVEYYVDPDNKDIIIGEYKKHYLNYTDDEIISKYNDDIPAVRRIFDILGANSALNPDYLPNENNIQIPN